MLVNCKQDAGGKGVGVHFGEGVQALCAKLARPAPGAVDAEHRAAPFRRGVNRIVEGIAERQRQTDWKNLKADEALLFDRALQLLRGGLWRAHRQNADALHTIGQSIVLRGEVIVTGARHRDLESELLEPDHASRTGWETHGGLDLMLVKDIVPARDLIAGRELAPGPFRDKVIEHVIVPRLIARTKRCRTLIPGLLKVLSDLAFFFDHMSVGIDCSELGHQFSPFGLGGV